MPERSQLGLESEPARTEDGAGSDWRRSLLGLESELARIEEGACSDRRGSLLGFESELAKKRRCVRRADVRWSEEVDSGG